MTTSAFTLTGTTSYVDEFSNAVAPAISATTNYLSIVGGSLDVPSGATAATSYTLSLGPITTVLALRLLNNTGAEMSLKYNGVTASYGVPVGGVEVKVFPTAPSNAITAIALVVVTPPAADGKIEYVIAGN